MSNDNESLCEQCGEQKASIYITEITDGRAVKKHICRRCYESEEDAPALSSSELISKLVGIIAPELRKAGKRKCPECGIDYVEFRQSFRFGCPNDYSVFHRALDDLFLEIHGARRHTGKIPVGRAQTALGGQERIELLRREMQRAVETEDYERAAHLKDSIEKMERTGVRDTEE